MTNGTLLNALFHPQDSAKVCIGLLYSVFKLLYFSWSISMFLPTLILEIALNYALQMSLDKISLLMTKLCLTMVLFLQFS